ncbi:Lissencephaly-1 [Yamadazyma tenuis]|nr:Lissencephaly-1 [Yamadazyma tenuis]
MKVLQVDDNSINDIIPNYLEKKWSTVLRLQKRIMDMQNDINNMKSITESQPEFFTKNTDKINWLPSTVSQVFKSHSNQQVDTVALHPCLPLIVCGCSDGTIIVWNLVVDDTIPEKIIKAHTRNVNKVVWSKKPIDINDNSTPEYVFASCSSDLSIKVWSGSSYKQLRNLMGHEHTVSSLAFSSSNPRFLYSVSRDRYIKSWDVINGHFTKSFMGHSDWVRNLDTICLNSKPDGSNSDASVTSGFGDFLLTCSNDQSIRLSHAESGMGLSLLIGHGHVVEDVKFLPLHSNRFIDQFLDENGSRFHTMPSRLVKDDIYTTMLGFKYCVSCGRDNSVKLWLLPPPTIHPHRSPTATTMNNSQGWLLDSFSGHTSWVKAVSVHPNGRFIFSCSDDKTIKVWDLEPLKEEGKVKCIHTLKGHEGFVTAIDFASFETDDILNSINDPEKLLKYIESKMRCVFVSASVDNTVRLWR